MERLEDTTRRGKLAQEEHRAKKKREQEQKTQGEKSNKMDKHLETADDQMKRQKEGKEQDQERMRKDRNKKDQEEQKPNGKEEMDGWWVGGKGEKQTEGRHSTDPIQLKGGLGNMEGKRRQNQQRMRKDRRNRPPRN